MYTKRQLISYIKHLCTDTLDISRSFHLVFYNRMKKFSRKTLEIMFVNIIDTGLSAADFEGFEDEQELLQLIDCTLQAMGDYVFHPD